MSSAELIMKHNSTYRIGNEKAQQETSKMKSLWINPIKSQEFLPLPEKKSRYPSSPDYLVRWF